MVEYILDSGFKIKCMEKGNSHGLMGKNTSEIMQMTKKMDMESFFGLREKFIKVNGKKVNSMVKDN